MCCAVLFGEVLVLVLRLPPLCHKEHAMRAPRQAGWPSLLPRTSAGGRRYPDGDVRSVGRFDKTDLAEDGRSERTAMRRSKRHQGAVQADGEARDGHVMWS